MNRYWIVSLAFFSTLALLQAQKAVQTTVEKLDISGVNAQFTEDGDRLVFTSQNFKGPYTYDIKTKRQEVITEAKGAGYNARIENGLVIYKNDTKSDSFFSFDLSSRKTSVFESHKNPQKPAHYLQTTDKIGSNRLIEAAPSANLRAIKLDFQSGSSKLISPLGDNDYINVSISPSGNQLVFRVSGIGAYVTNLEGDILTDLGKVEFPKWAGDDKILCTETIDNGYNYTKSDVFLFSTNEDVKWKLTDKINAIALYPSINRALDRVVFNTPNGELFIVEIQY